MPIDFHATANARTYAGRNAHTSWSAAIRGVLDPHGLAVVDVGCGGGVYTQAWLDLGAASVVALDLSCVKDFGQSLAFSVVRPPRDSRRAWCGHSGFGGGAVADRRVKPDPVVEDLGVIGDRESSPPARLEYHPKWSRA